MFASNSLLNEEINYMIRIDDIQSAKAKDDGNKVGRNFARLKSKMFKITEDGKVMKLIKRRMISGELIPSNALAIFDYVGFFEYADAPFCSSYRQERPKIVPLGRGLLIPGLELAIESMTKNEISMFIIHPDLVYGNLEYLPRFLSDNEVLFSVKLIDFENSEIAELRFNQVVKENKLFSNKVGHINALLEMAKCAFMVKEYGIALEKYEKAINLLVKAELKDGNEKEEVMKLLSRSYTNQAICFNKLNICHASLICMKVRRPTVKTHFTHGRALIKIGEYEKSLKELQLAHEMEPTNKTVNKEIALAKEKFDLYYQIEKYLWSNCFYLTEKEREIEFRKAVQEMFKSFVKDNYVVIQPFPIGLTSEEENYICQEVSALDHNIFLERKNTGKIYLTKCV